MYRECLSWYRYDIYTHPSHIISTYMMLHVYKLRVPPFYLRVHACGCGAYCLPVNGQRGRQRPVHSLTHKHKETGERETQKDSSPPSLNFDIDPSSKLINMHTIYIHIYIPLYTCISHKDRIVFLSLTSPAYTHAARRPSSAPA
jgi:hypothetical protein